RSWHNSRALNDQWNRLNIVMVISTEPYLLIADVTQSPFNVGLKLYLRDFDEAQVHDLNQRHGSPVHEGDFLQFMKLFNGHPYLTRKALYTLVTERLAWANLASVAATDQGPFSDHLRHHHWLLHNEPDLREALKQIILQNRCTDEMAFFRLLRAGLVKGSGEVCKCRCDLYRTYFEDKL
nr:AAA-like domain-containing protein [Chloroflexota bacterium]